MRFALPVLDYESYIRTALFIAEELRRAGHESVFVDLLSSCRHLRHIFVRNGFLYCDGCELADDGDDEDVETAMASFDFHRRFVYKSYDVSTALYSDKTRTPNYRRLAFSFERHRDFARSVNAAERALNLARIDGVFILNGSAIVAQLAFKAVCQRRKCPIVYLEKGFFPRSLVFDERGINRASSLGGKRWERIAIDPKEVAENSETVGRYLREFVARGVTLHSLADDGEERLPVREQLDIPSDARVVLFPCQVDSDSNITFHAPVIRSQSILIRRVLDLLDRELQDCVLVVKTHPQDAFLPSDFMADKRLRVTATANLHEIIQCCDLVVTINSNVGFEALAFGKAVLCTGRSLYSEKGFTYDLLRVEDLHGTIRQALSRGMTKEMHQTYMTFIYYILRYYLYFEGNAPFPKSNGEKIARLEQRARDYRKTMAVAGPVLTFANQEKEAAKYCDRRKNYQDWLRSLDGRTGNILIIDELPTRGGIRVEWVGFEKRIGIDDLQRFLRESHGFGGHFIVPSATGYGGSCACLGSLVRCTRGGGNGVLIVSERRRLGSARFRFLQRIIRHLPLHDCFLIDQYFDLLEEPHDRS